jgi:hypothetical protein
MLTHSSLRFEGFGLSRTSNGEHEERLDAAKKKTHRVLGSH